MAPNISRHNYPITTGLCQLSPLSGHAKDDFPQLNSLTSLAHLDKKPMDDYLKQVMRHLKGAFEIYPKSTICIKIQQLKKLPHPTTLQALGILNQGLLQSHILLKNVIQLGSDPEIGEGEVVKLKKLKEHLLTLTRFLDGIFMYYSNFCMGCKAPLVEEIKRTAKKLYKVINSMKPDKLHGLFPNILVTEEDILCSVLGLQGDVAHKLRELSPELRNHQTDMYFLLQFLEEHGEYSESLTDTDTMASKLQEMGFTENRSDVIAKWIAEQSFPEHRSLLAWAQHYIENLFKYDIFLNDCVCRYPYKEKVLDKWFTVSVERDKEDDDGVVKTNVRIMNTTRDTPKDTSRLIDEKLKQIQQEQPGKFYFHGTDHEGANRILEDGINLGAGKRGCDFSDGGGFYLTESHDYAKEWSEKNDASAVLVFNIISENHLSGYKSLDLSDRESDRKCVIEYYRGINRKLPPKLKRACQNCDFIIGPISRDGSKTKPEAVYKQICIKEKAMANSIGSPANICAVIFKNR